MELGPSGPIKSRDWTRVLLPLHSPRRRPSLSWSEAASLPSRGAPPLLAHSLPASALANRRYRSRGARSSPACHRPASATLPAPARGGDHGGGGAGSAPGRAPGLRARGAGGDPIRARARGARPGPSEVASGRCPSQFHSGQWAHRHSRSLCQRKLTHPCR